MLDHADPWAALDAWLEDATAAELRVPDAMQLATVDPSGRPTLRTVLLKDHGPDRGLVFYTNTGSRKGRQVAAHPHVAVLLHWKSLERQVIAEGPARPVDPAAADAYWATRPRGSQLGAWASRQSEPLSDAGELQRRLAEVTARFEGQTVPRPPFWTGFALSPDRFEFWQGRGDRLHERTEFTAADAGWRRAILHP